MGRRLRFKRLSRFKQISGVFSKRQANSNRETKYSKSFNTMIKKNLYRSFESIQTGNLSVLLPSGRKCARGPGGKKRCKIPEHSIPRAPSNPIPQACELGFLPSLNNFLCAVQRCQGGCISIHYLISETTSSLSLCSLRSMSNSLPGETM